MKTSKIQQSVINPLIVQLMTKNLSFDDAYAIEYVLNRGKMEGNFIFVYVALIGSIAGVVMVEEPFIRMASALMAVLFLRCAIMLFPQESRRIDLFRDIEKKVSGMEKTFGLSNTNVQPHDKIVGDIRKVIVECAKEVVIAERYLEFLKKNLPETKETVPGTHAYQIGKHTAEIAMLKTMLGNLLDTANECLDTFVDNGRGLTNFFQQAKKSLAA